MPALKILITGGAGYLGQYLNKELSKENEILTLYNKNTGNCKEYNSQQVSINDYKKLEEVVNNFKPDVIVHTAAVSNPQMANSLPAKEVYSTNVNAVKKLAEFSNQYKAKLIFTSTDLVYAGYRGSMLDENFKLIPVSLYAETKLMGEVKIKEISENFLILRMALMYGFGLNHSKSHFDQMYRNFKEGKPVRLFHDQYRTPISLFDAARVINHLAKHPVKNEIINVGGKERVSRLELGERLCDTAGFDKNLIEKISMDDIPDLPQVADVSLNTDKLQSYGIKLLGIDESLNEVLLGKNK